MTQRSTPCLSDNTVFEPCSAMSYVKQGQAGQPLILLHGLGNSLAYWTSVVAAFPASQSVLAVDLPGFGNSLRRERLTLDTMTERVLGLLDNLVLASDAVIVGHSLGGLVAASVAARAPQRLSTLVLVDGTIYRALRLIQSDLSYMISHPRLVGHTSIQFFGAAMPFKRATATLLARSQLARRVALWPFVVSPATLEPSALACALRGNRGGRALLDIIRSAATLDLERLLHNVSIPTHIIVGEGDRLVSPVDVAFYREHLQHVVDVHRLDATGHWPMLEAPARLARILERIANPPYSPKASTT